MTNPVAALRELDAALAAVVVGQLRDGDVRALDGDELLAVMDAAASVVRRAEALLVDTVGEVDARSDQRDVSVRMTTKYGCRSVRELAGRATRFGSRRAGDLVTAGRGVRRARALATGEVLPPVFPALRETLSDGFVGVDGVVAVVGELDGLRVGREAILAADEELAAAARGEGVDGAPPLPADDLRAQAAVWAAFLDQDGPEPREARAFRKRGVTLGVVRDGLIPIRGNLLPEAAGLLTRTWDSINNPKLAGPTGPRFVSEGDEDPDAVCDTRTRAQKQHDALVTALSVATASGQLPTIGGGAPTLVVSVREADVKTGTGSAHVQGIDEPVSLAVARHTACTGGVQRVVSDAFGRIVSIAVTDRVFTHTQRKAIVLRDGECVIPGCHVPAAWCEIHHVVEAARGGPTHTDNGLLLCWFHHRTIDTGGWKVRMNHGVPEILGPVWWDPAQKWRPVTKSPTRRRELLEAAHPR
ncbi:DUF222 domain-containing protein [Microbacterium sp. P06]|uniref:HNH endonuclease signature motif containing protein n=1 Tax=Microbacterium sp. P06 TaxID=3366949 RepID=UPI0037473475